MPTLKLLAPLSAAILLVAACATTGAEDKPAKGEGDPKVLASRNNQFGFELMGKLHEEGKNLFISPVSISTALQMTAGGAQGERAMRWPKPCTSMICNWPSTTKPCSMS